MRVHDTFLSGYAWAANVGWIHFGWANGGNRNLPRFSVHTGEFSGYAWSANAGWVNLGSGLLRSEGMSITDRDGDGISDTWELQHTASLPPLTATGDADRDGISDVPSVHRNLTALSIIRLNTDDKLDFYLLRLS